MRVNSLAIRWLAVLLALCLAVPQLLEARVEPTRGFDLFSAQEEVQAGQQAAGQVSRQLPVLPDSDAIARYVQRLGRELASHAPGEKWPYTFHVVNQKQINAFALPGGPVYVNLGTIQAADNEAELAGVMAHEISHVVQRHGTRAASKQMAAQLPLAILGGVMGRGALAQMAAQGISFGVGSYFLKNSRQAEREADLLGTDIMYDTGFDPHAMAQFFTKLQRQGGSGARGPQFLSDHPDPGNRAEAVSREVSTLPRKSNYRGDSPDFREIKQRVSAMSPLTAQQIAALQKQGGISAAGVPESDQSPSGSMRSFNHSDFQISYPENWQVFGDRNSAVTIAPRSGVSQNAVAYGVMINDFQPEDPQASLDQAVHDLLASVRQSNPDLRQIGYDENIRINGMAGKSVDLIGTSPVQDQDGRAAQERDWLVAMRRRDRSLLYLVFIAPDKDFGSLRPTFEQMLRSLQPR
ncbi:MAG TPA: M48 family metallopeptidase [Terriglobales bacterium]|nr:M48 family metallopeptidase [Terriglobales bacterium]